MAHPGGTTRPAAPSARLTGRWLLAARICWFAMAALALAVFVAGLPGAYALSDTLCHAVGCSNNDQLTSGAVQQLRDLGLSLAFYAGYDVGLKSVSVLVFMAVAAVIFWRASADRVALVAAFTFVTFPITLTHLASTLPVAWVLPAQILDVLGSIGMTLLFLTFPNGHFVPRWAGWVMVTQVLYAVKVFVPAIFNSPAASGLPLLALVTFLSIAQLYRYRRVSTPVERQQTKWIVLGLAVGFGPFILILAAFLLVPDLSERNTLLYLTLSALVFLSQLVFPLSIGVALQRYRLWDVDALIGRVVTYGLLTGLLGALYVGMILALQNLAGRFTHQGADNPLALVISTLAIAALVQPVRRWLQHGIDRRFYRARHDAAKTLATFSATLRQQTDLEQVRAQLLAVVDETMRPAHVSLWLRPPLPTGREVPR